MATPEGKVKDQVKKVFKKYPDVYVWWPVPSGYGESSLDCLFCVNGYFGAVETKAPGKKPTPRQEECIRKMKAAGVTVFVIDGQDEQLKALDKFLKYYYPVR